MPLVAVAAPAGQVLQGGPGGVPVAPAAGRLPAGFGAQQPVRVDPVPPVGRHGRSPPEVASVGALASAAAPPLLACPVGPFGIGGGRGQ